MKTFIFNRYIVKYEIPCIVSCIDCTHIAVVRSLIDNEEYPEYVVVNRQNNWYAIVMS